ncbi:hypothetical protein PAXRUDRAFT_154345, partial [Paxillus rubicundulus Ve08.2h10]
CEPSLPLSPNVEFHNLPRMSDSPMEQEMLDHGTVSVEDLDIMTFGSDLPNLSPNFHGPEALLAAVDHFTAYNEGTLFGAWPLTVYKAHHHLPVDPKECAMQHEVTRLLDEVHQEETYSAEVDQAVDDQADLDESLNDVGDVLEDDAICLGSSEHEDHPDPFMVEETFHSDDHDTPPHLLTVYTLVSWIHLQFHLPRVACNTILAILTCILVLLSPTIATPFITLQSSNRVLGVNKLICLLPVCPSCCNVFPPSGSLHTQDTCTLCDVPLFQLEHTK